MYKNINKKSAVIFVLSLVFFAALTVLTVHGQTQTLNSKIASDIQSLENSSLTVFMKIISGMGEWYVYVPVAVLLLIIPKTRIKVGLPSAAALAVSAGLNTVLKLWFAVPRPDVHRLITETGYGFPSGHAMNGTAFVGICVILFMRSSFKKTAKISVLVAGIVFLILVGFSRIYLGVHNPGDIIGGYFAGICICSITVFAVDAAKNHSKFPGK
ncbi:MAG: phosphatase PAP2 family protein [Oscillospiraceae bacterium]|nr:phosphatase PAP2 family protein [Oscillospiraceae bacterium]